MLRQAVMTAAPRPEVRAAVADLYADLQAEIDARRPLCTASGRCCHFDAFGHRLFVTTMELAAFVHALDKMREGEAPAEPLLSAREGEAPAELLLSAREGEAPAELLF